MRRDDIPEQNLLLEPQLPEHPVHERRRHLRRAGPGELPLRREGDAGDAGTAITGGLADKQEWSRVSRLEVRD
jgi:hypothetical protein